MGYTDQLRSAVSRAWLLAAIEAYGEVCAEATRLSVGNVQKYAWERVFLKTGAVKTYIGAMMAGLKLFCLETLLHIGVCRLDKPR